MLNWVLKLVPEVLTYVTGRDTFILVHRGQFKRKDRVT